MRLSVKCTAMMLLMVCGCGHYLGSHISQERMQYSSPAMVPSLPGEGEALVYFIRPGEHTGFMLLAVIYNDDEFIGFLPNDKMFPYYASEGEHLFMVYSDAEGAKPCVRFLQAELLEGEIYAVLISPIYIHLVDAGLELSPVHPRSYGFRKEWREWMMDAQMLSNNTNAYRWAEQNHESVLETKERFFKKWTRKDVTDRPTLKKEYIIPYPHDMDSK